MSIHDKDLLTGRDKVETAIARLHNFCDGKRVLCAFSGGKDSQCVYHLLKTAGIPFSPQYSVTRFEPPELTAFIREHYPEVKFRRAYKRSLVKDIEDFGLPNRWYRWCCACKHKKTDGFDVAAIGIRAEESARRRARWSVFGTKADRTHYVCPIIDWTEADVWELLTEMGVPHCSLYDEGHRRIGCVCCPLSPSHMKENAERWPKIASMLRLANRMHIERISRGDGKTKRGKRYMLYKADPEEVFERWLSTGATLPKKTSEEEDLPCLFAGTGFSESDRGEEKEWRERR